MMDVAIIIFVINKESEIFVRCLKGLIKTNTHERVVLLCMFNTLPGESQCMKPPDKERRNWKSLLDQ